MTTNKFLNSLKIIHDELRGLEYRFLADFFRMTGFFVYECTLKNENVSSQFDVVIIISESIESENLESLCAKYIDAIILEKMNGKQKSKYLKNCINAIYEKSTSGDQSLLNKEKDALLRLAEIFNRHNIMKSRNIFSYFSGLTESVKEVQLNFAHAYSDIRKIPEKNVTKQVLYAEGTMARYLNEACKILNTNFLFDTQKCFNRLDRAMEQDPNFSNLLALKGFMAELDPYMVKESKEYYKLVLTKEGEQPYAGYLHYRLGRYYEKQETDWEKAEEEYKKAVAVNEWEYRAIYKLLVINRRKGNYTEAAELAKKIINILSGKLKENYLQRKEYEYVLKAYLELENIGARKNNEEMEKSARDKSEQIREMIKLNRPKNEIYRQIYGKEEEKFMKETYRKLSGNMCGYERKVEENESGRDGTIK